MKKTISLFLITMYTLTLKVDAQTIDKALAAKYTPSALMQVYDATTQLKLDEKKQNLIAAIFQVQDNSLIALIQKGANTNSIDSLKRKTSEKIMLILSNEQQQVYRSTIKLNKDDNQLLEIANAIKFRDSLKINGTQLDSLLRVSEAQKKMPKTKFSNIDTIKPAAKKKIENEAVRRILNATQIALLVQIENQLEAQKKALAKWNQIEKLGLDKNYDRSTTLNELEIYYFKKQDVAAIKALQKQELPKSEKTKEPKILSVLADANKDDSNKVVKNNISLVNAAQKYAEQLMLTKIQLDSLIAFEDGYKRMKKEIPVNGTVKPLSKNAFESKALNKLLTDSQFVKLLFIKNKDEARQTAEIKWKLLEEKGLNTTYEKNKTIAEIEKFYFDKFCVSDKYAHDKVKLSDLLRSINANKPQALKALEHAQKNKNNDTIGKSFKW